MAVAFVAVVDNSAFAAVDVVANVGVVASTDVTIETVAAVADVAIKAVVAVGVLRQHLEEQPFIPLQQVNQVAVLVQRLGITTHCKNKTGLKLVPSKGRRH